MKAHKRAAVSQPSAALAPLAVNRRSLMDKTPPHTIAPLAVSVPEGCRLTGIKRSSMYREIALGRIKAVKARGRTLIPVKALQSWIEKLPPAEIDGSAL
jgi:excisionase family DNA binding protein